MSTIIHYPALSLANLVAACVPKSNGRQIQANYVWKLAEAAEKISRANAVAFNAHFPKSPVEAWEARIIHAAAQDLRRERTSNRGDAHLVLMNVSADCTHCAMNYVESVEGAAMAYVLLATAFLKAIAIDVSARGDVL